MTDLPIIFSAPMVRALLDGRKTMTRRILKPQPEQARDRDGNLMPHGILHVEGDPRPRITIGRVVTTQEARYAPGDRLWVRESYAIAPDGMPVYAADDFKRGAIDASDLYEAGIKCRPSIHLPRKLSRLTLLVNATKIERVQEIKRADAIAEGVVWIEADRGWTFDHKLVWGSPRDAFAGLWSSLHGEEAWDTNPEVVAISFEVHKANIDQLPKEGAKP